MLCYQALSRQDDAEFHVADTVEMSYCRCWPVLAWTSLRSVEVFAFSGTIATGEKERAEISVYMLSVGFSRGFFFLSFYFTAV